MGVGGAFINGKVRECVNECWERAESLRSIEPQLMVVAVVRETCVQNCSQNFKHFY